MSARQTFFLALPWICLLLSLSFSFGSDRQDYRLNHQYFKAPQILPQKTIEIHYFMSFQCAGCGKLYPILEPYFHENAQDPVFTHALAANQAGVQLVKAYEILKNHNQGQQYIRALYSAPSKTQITDKEILQMMKKAGAAGFDQWWANADDRSIQDQMAKDVRYAQAFKLKMLPIVYIVGPLGGFYLHPSPDLPLEAIPNCIAAVISLQKEINSPRPK